MSLVKHFYKEDKKIFRELLKNQEIKPEEYIDLYEILKNSNDDEDIFYIYDFLDKNPEAIDYKKLSKITGLDISILNKIFKTKPVKAYFPIANNNHSEIATAYIFKFEKELPFNSFTKKPELENIKKLIKGKNLDIKDFFVIFDKNFKQTSYLLAVISGLFLPEEILSRYAFTGEVNSEGEINEVDFIPQKEEACKKEGLKLINPDIISNLDELLFYLNSKEIDIPFLALNQPKEEIKKSIKKIESKIKERKPLYSVEKLLKIFDLKEENLFIKIDRIPPEKEKWQEILSSFSEKIKNIYSIALPSKITLHIATSIASLSFGMGVILGAKRSYILYHFQNEEYFPLIDLSTPEKSRKIKHVKKDILQKQDYINLEINIKQNTKEANLILYLASHNPVADVVNFTKNENYIYISDKNYQGSIPLKTEIWREYISEIYSAINMTKEKYLINKFNLFISSPSIMALALGMAVGDFMDIAVYNYYRELPEKYFKVFETLQLKTIV